MTFLRVLGGFSALTACALIGCRAPAPPLVESDMHALVGAVSTNVFMAPNNQLLTPAGKIIELRGMRPQAVALSPDGKILVTAGKTHDLAVFSTAEGKILQHVTLPSDSAHDPNEDALEAPILAPDKDGQLSFTGLIFSPDGSRIYLSDVTGDIKVFRVDKDGKISASFSIPLLPASAPRRKNEIPAGLALSRDGQRLYVCGNLSNRLLELDANTGKFRRGWAVGVAPFDVVLVGNKAYVSNWGGRRPDASSLTGPAGRGTEVRVDPVRFIASEGSVSIINLDGAGAQTGREDKELLTGLHASALAVSLDQRWVVVANSGSDTLSVIDTRTDQIVEKIWARQSPADLFGAQPNALAFDPSGRTLYVCNGTQNAVAVVDFRPGKSELRGLIPVGWFPGAVAVGGHGGNKSLFVANIKGLASNRSLKPEKNNSNTHEHRGSLSIVPVPSDKQLKQHTLVALRNMRYGLLEQSRLPARDDQPPRPVPERVGEPSVFKHVIYIIKENRTYDQVFGDIRAGNGNPSLCIFGERITPNQHKLVREFALLDNTYCSGVLSADGHQWANTAIATEYVERSFAGWPRSYPSGGEFDNCRDALAYSPAGFIWDDARAHGVNVRVYGEFTSTKTVWADSSRKGTPTFLDCYNDFIAGRNELRFNSEPDVDSLRPIMATNFPSWDLKVPDVTRADMFIREFQEFERRGDLPEFMILWLPNDHTSGTKAGMPTPAAHVADNDLAFGRIVEAVSHSRAWKDTCIFAIEDDPQDGWDHVSGFRTTAYVISPYTKRGAVIGTQYNQTSLLRTMELILGLPPMNQMDATATPMTDCFAATPDFTPFNAVTNNVPLDQLNPDPRKLGNAALRKNAQVSARLPLAKADACPEDTLNRILWAAMRGPDEPYPAWAVRVVGDDDD